jgi:hypothetical protein
MSNLSTQVFGDMNYLYEHIANRDAQQLNENSDHYDEEFAELVEDIISTISLSMVYEGYSANGIISFLASSPNEDIIEKYLSFDENIITESVVSEDYIVEQLDQLNEFVGAALRVLGAGLKAAKYAKGVKGLAPVSRLASGLKGAGTAAERVAKQGFKQSSVIRSGLTKGVEKVKDIAKSAKAVLTSPTAKKVGLGALGAGALVGLPYAGVKLAMDGAGSKESLSAKPKPNPKSPASEKPPAAPKLPPPSNNGGGGGSSSPSAKPKASTKPKKSDKGPAGETPMQQWARLHPKQASKVKPGQSGYDEISQTRVKPGPNEKKDQTPTAGPEASDAQKSQAGAEVAAIQAKQKAEFEKKQKEAASTQKESYDAYDLVLEYLLNTGHAHTIAEAEYVMSELDSETIDSIVESYQ